jgi:hypothetical protein
MATIIKQITLDAPAEGVWDAVADFGEAHRRFAPGFVTDVQLVEGARMVTFADGTVTRELFVGRDDATRRLAYSIQSLLLAHHAASFQVDDLGGGKSQLTWTVDVLPDEMADYLDPRMDAGLAVAKKTLERVPA